MQNYLTADNLTVGYRGKPILSDISMNIRRGSIVTLIVRCMIETVTPQLGGPPSHRSSARALSSHL